MRYLKPCRPTQGSTVQSVAEDAAGGVWIGFNIFGPQDGRGWLWKDGRCNRLVPRWAAERLGDLDFRGSIPASLGWDTGRVVRTAGQPVPAGVRCRGAGDCTRITPAGSGSARQQGLAQWNGAAPNFSRPGTAFQRTMSAPSPDDRDGNLWLGTSGGGLNRMREGKFIAYRKAADGLPSDNITALCVDKDDDGLWIGTSGNGLARLHAGQWSHFTVREGLISDSIYYLIEDNLGCLWIGCNNGLMRVRKRDLQTFAPGATQLHLRPGLRKTGRHAGQRMHLRFAAGRVPDTGRQALVSHHQGPRHSLIPPGSASTPIRRRS